MYMKIKEMTRFLRSMLGSRFVGITIAPFGIYIRRQYISHQKLINHEKIHWKQQMEMGIIFFYIWYVIEWLIRIFVNRGNSYRSISFEREANDNDHDLLYINKRKSYSWMKYIFKKSFI